MIAIEGNMASSPENSDETFPSADIAAELNPGNNTEVQVDPISSEVAASKEIKVHALIVFSMQHWC